MSATRSGSPPAPAARAAAGEPTTAFVLSGGASLCALQVGMLHALYERGVVPDLLVATSVGALNAAFVASRPQTVTTARELGRVWRNLEREDIFPVSMSALIGGFCGPRNHLVPDRGLRRLVRRHLELDVSRIPSDVGLKPTLGQQAEPVQGGVERALRRPLGEAARVPSRENKDPLGTEFDRV